MSLEAYSNLLFTPAPLINITSRALQRIGERRLKALGLSTGQMPVLYALRDGSAKSQRDLAKLARIEQPSMAQMLARMERDGLIRRAPDPRDGRSSLVTLTPSALEKLPLARAALDEGQSEMLAGFSPEEVQALTRLLVRLNGNLDRLIDGQISPGD